MEQPRLLPADALEVFKAKGLGNAVKVRRILQVTRDLSGGNLAGLRILDLGCGEGVYAIEAGLRGAEVLGIDGRTERMRNGIRIATELALPNVRFLQADVRNLDAAALGTFDVVWLLGLLYHLASSDTLRVLRSARALCRRALLVDSHVSLTAEESFSDGDNRYFGLREREHLDEESADQRRARVQASLDNTFSFWPTHESAVRLLRDVGFTSVFEVKAPLEPYKQREGHAMHDRITLLALVGEPVAVASYPWINGLSEAEIARQRLALFPPAPPLSPLDRLKGLVKSVLRRLGWELKRVRR